MVKQENTLQISTFSIKSNFCALHWLTNA